MIAIHRKEMQFDCLVLYSAGFASTTNVSKKLKKGEQGTLSVTAAADSGSVRCGWTYLSTSRILKTGKTFTARTHGHTFIVKRDHYFRRRLHILHIKTPCFELVFGELLWTPDQQTQSETLLS